MVAYEVETEDLVGIGQQLQLQADGLVSTRDGVNSASLEMLQAVAAGVTLTTTQIQQVFAELEAATRAAASAADSAQWTGPDAEQFRASNSALLEAITASEQRLQEAVAAHTESTGTLDSDLRGTLGVFTAEAGRNHDLAAQLAQAVGEELESLELAFNGTWAYDGGAGAAPPPAPEPPAPAQDTDLAGEGLSLVLGLIPGVGTVKGVIEAVTGKDLITGRTLEPWERALGVIPYAGKLGAGVRLVRGVNRAVDAGEAARAARSARAGAGEVRGAAAAPGAARRDASVVPKGDPVDITTGRVFLPQVDVELPGALPLAIGRRFDSGYRLGRSFGPTWATVLDERIEIDEHGAMLVRGNGATLAYPLPVPGGEAVLPGSGTFRWPLSRDIEGVFRVVDPALGISYLYQAPSAPDGSAPTDIGADPAWLVRIEDRAGRWWAIVRDADRDGVPLLVVHHGGYQIVVRTDSFGRVLALDIPDPNDESSDARLGAYGYDDAGNLTQVVTATGGSLRFGYDDRGRMTGWVDSNDRAYEYTYDERDRCVRQGAAGGIMAFSYAYSEDPAVAGPGRVQTTLTDPLGHRTRYVADASTRLLLEEISPAGGVTRHGYDEWANPLSRTEPTGGTTHWTWDEQGRLTSTTDPLGATTTLQRDAGKDGRDLVITYPDGAAVTYRLDDAGEVCAVVDPAGAVTMVETGADGEAAGSVVRVVDPRGAVTSTTIDRAGLPLTVADAAGGTTTIVRDGLGRPVEVTDPVGTVTSMTWRIDGKPLARRIVSGSELVSAEHWEWDGEGNCTRYTDPAGRVTGTEFGDFDHPLAQTAPDGTRIELVRDASMRPVRIVNQLGDSWVLEYDPAGNVVAETDYAGRRIVREFDLGGRLTLEVNGAAQSRSYAYDLAGRLASVTSDRVVIRFGYDAVGRLVTADGPDVTVERTYDARGLLTAETVGGATTTWRYDAAGQVVGRSTPAGVESTRSYDEAGRLATLATAGHQLSLSHDLAGREVARALASLTAGAGVVIGSRWSPLGRLASRTVRAGSDGSIDGAGAHWSVLYGYTPVGELATRVDSALGASRYELDAAGRVSTVSSGDGGTTYGYDAAGNLTADEPSSRDGRGRTATGRAWAYLKGRLVRAGRDRYGYDEQGRLVRRRRALLSGGSRDWTYTWDAADRLTEVTTPDGSTWRYTYDPFGRRIVKQHLHPDGTPGERVTFVWEDTEIVEQTTTDPATGAVTSVTWDRMPDGTPATHTTTRRDAIGPRGEVLLGPGHAAVVGRDGDPGTWDRPRVDSEFYALVTDLVGAPIRAVTPDGETAWVARPTLWNPAGSHESDRGVEVPLRFPGQYADAETGLFYNVNRYYDPDTARYISPDPLGLEPAPNAYTYPANPTTHIDPLGLAPAYPGSAGAGRGRMQPDPSASGPHSTFKRDADGTITHYATWLPNTDPRNPQAWVLEKRVDIVGRPHFNKVTGQSVPTPHVQGRGIPGGVRPAEPWELP